MKIVHIIDYFQPQVGYQETFLAREQIKKGHDVYVITSDRYFPFPHYEKSAGTLLGKRYVGPKKTAESEIPTIRLSSFEIPGSNLIFLTHLFPTLKKINPDFILCHGVHSFTSYRISRYKKKLHAKVLFDTHASSFNTNFTRSLATRLYHQIYKKIFLPSIKRNAYKIIAVGDDEREFIARELGWPIKSVPLVRLGVDTSLFKYSQEARRRIRKKYDISPSETLIVHAGKLTRNKDIHILLSAFSKRPDKNIRLCIIGGGDSDYIESLKSSFDFSNIVSVPFVKNDQLPLFYSAADIGIWPGDFSITLYEALSTGLATIAADMQSTHFLSINKVIMSFPRGNSDRLSEKIKILTQNSQKRKKLGQKASEFAKKNLKWSSLSEKILHL